MHQDALQPPGTQTSPSVLADPVPSSVPRLLPRYVIQVPESPDLSGAIVSPDGTKIHAVAGVEVVDVGALARQYIPLAGRCVLSLFLVAAAVWLLRGLLRRRGKGTRHCRRCDYDLTDLISEGTTHCPECGMDLSVRTPVSGRSVAARVLCPSVGLLLIASTWIWFEACGKTSLQDRVPKGRWGSRAIQQWGARNSVAWDIGIEHEGDILLELDAQTGATQREIAVRAERTTFFLAGNSRANACYLSTLTGLDLVSLRDGSIIAHLPGPTQIPATPLVIGHSDDLSRVYLSSDSIKGETDLIEWDWTTGSSRTLAHSATPDARSYVTADGSRFLAYAPGSLARGGKRFEISLLGSEDLVTRRNISSSPKDVKGTGASADLSAKAASFAIPVLSPDSRTLYLPGWGLGTVVAFDTATFNLLWEIPCGSGGIGRGVFLRPDGRLLLVPRTDSVAVLDLQTKTWVCVLQHPSDVLVSMPFSFSADGLTLATVMQNVAPGGSPLGPFGYKLAVWNLPPALASTPPGARAAVPAGGSSTREPPS